MAADDDRRPESPIVAVYTGPDEPDRPRGRFLRVVPTEMWGVENNLSLANMDFEDFADSADSADSADGDGIFRGFA